MKHSLKSYSVLLFESTVLYYLPVVPAFLCSKQRGLGLLPSLLQRLWIDGHIRRFQDGTVAAIRIDLLLYLKRQTLPDSTT